MGFFGAITASARSIWLVWKLRRAVIAWVSEDVVAGRERARMVNGILEAMIGDGCLLAWIVRGVRRRGLEVEAAEVLIDDG